MGPVALTSCRGHLFHTDRMSQAPGIGYPLKMPWVYRRCSGPIRHFREAQTHFAGMYTSNWWSRRFEYRGIGWASRLLSALFVDVKSMVRTETRGMNENPRLYGRMKRVFGAKSIPPTPNAPNAPNGRTFGRRLTSR